MSQAHEIRVGGTTVQPGSRAEVELEIGRQATGARLTVPVIVVHGAQPGPRVWITAAIHGDEINGVEIIRRVVEGLEPAEMRGTLLALPVVNVLGFMTGSRYLPDRRDLNRSFPGSARGSLASRIANLVMGEVVEGSDVGIDLHTGSDHRTNLPQLRGDFDDERTKSLAEAFGAPVLIHSSTRDGSLRRAAADRGCAVLLYEAGEAWRFDETAIRVGVSGCLRVLATVGTIEDDFDVPDAGPPPMESRRSHWIRARRSGIALHWTSCGDLVTKGQVVGRIHDAFGNRLCDITSNEPGLVVGQALDPVVNQGDALLHVAILDDDTGDGESAATDKPAGHTKPDTGTSKDRL